MCFVINYCLGPCRLKVLVFWGVFHLLKSSLGQKGNAEFLFIYLICVEEPT